jgi:hypothetical protein
MKKMILAVAIVASCFANDNKESVDLLKGMNLSTPLLLQSIKKWVDIHEKNINSLSPEEIEKITKTKEFYGIHMITVFEWCKDNKASLTCIDKDYLK